MKISNLFRHKRKIYKQSYTAKNPIIGIMGIYDKGQMPISFKIVNLEELEKEKTYLYNNVAVCAIGHETIYFFSDYDIKQVIVKEVSDEQMAAEMGYLMKKYGLPYNG